MSKRLAAGNFMSINIGIVFFFFLIKCGQIYKGGSGDEEYIKGL